MRFLNLGKKLALGLQALTLTLGLSTAGMVVLAAQPAYAATCDTTTLSIQSGADCANPGTTSKGLFDNGGIFQTISTTLIFIVGAISVLFVIIGGLRYVISNGDAKAVEGAKNTILYAIVGVIVAILSFAAVQFVISTFTK